MADKLWFLRRWPYVICGLVWAAVVFKWLPGSDLWAVAGLLPLAGVSVLRWWLNTLLRGAWG